MRLRYPKGVTLFAMINEWTAEEFSRWCTEAHEEAEDNPDWWKSEESQKNTDQDMVSLKKHTWGVAIYNLLGDIEELSSEDMHELICMANHMPVTPTDPMSSRPENSDLQHGLTKMMRSGHIIKYGSELSRVTGRRVIMYRRAESPPRYFNHWINRAIRGSGVEFLPENIAKRSPHYGDEQLSFNHGFAGAVANLFRDGERRTCAEVYNILSEANGLKMDPTAPIQSRPMYINVKSAVNKLVREEVINNLGKVGRKDMVSRDGRKRETKWTVSQYEWRKGATYTHGHGKNYGDPVGHGTNGRVEPAGDSQEAVVGNPGLAQSYAS